MSASDLEQLFAFQVKAAGLPEPEREVCVIPGRKFRFDFCWREARLLVEINGGTFTRGGHSTGTGIRRDYTKQNLCQIAGYKLLTFDADMVKSGQALDFTEKMLRGDNG